MRVLACLWLLTSIAFGQSGGWLGGDDEVIEYPALIKSSEYLDNLVGESVEVQIIAPATVKAGATFPVQILIPKEAADHYRFEFKPPPKIPPLELQTRDGKPVFLIYGIDVTTEITVFVQIPAPGLDPIGWKSATITVDGSPQPEPGPQPEPEPEPDNPAPIPEPGFRVLVIYETGDTIPPAQAAILYGKETREYLNLACVPEPDGKTKAWRIYDKDIPLKDDLKIWREAMGRKRESIPWVIISNGKTGYEGPLPGTVAEFLTLCRKYEGP